MTNKGDDRGKGYRPKHLPRVGPIEKSRFVGFASDADDAGEKHDSQKRRPLPCVGYQHRDQRRPGLTDPIDIDVLLGDRAQECIDRSTLRTKQEAKYVPCRDGIDEGGKKRDHQEHPPPDDVLARQQQREAQCERTLKKQAAREKNDRNADPVEEPRIVKGAFEVSVTDEGWVGGRQRRPVVDRQPYCIAQWENGNGEDQDHRRRKIEDPFGYRAAPHPVTSPFPGAPMRKCSAV